VDGDHRGLDAASTATPSARTGKKKGLLYLGTERGVMFSPDAGKTWKSLQLNLPTVPVHDLVVKDDDLVVGTHGRSIWILDDLTPVRETTDAIRKKAAHLFPVQPATRWRVSWGGPTASFTRRAAGENPRTTGRRPSPARRSIWARPPPAFPSPPAPTR
jgi:hypothetical protein